MAPEPIPFYFDFVSPYAYLAWCRAPALAAKHGTTLRPRPVLFAGVLDALGTRGPAEVPPRRAYLYKNLVRVAAEHGLPFTLPPAHPFNSLLPLRLAGSALLDGHEAARAAAISALYDAVWATGQGLETPADVLAALAPVALPVAAEALVADAATDAAKQRLRDTTAELVTRGGFGVPSLFATRPGDTGGEAELFFGFDSLPHLDAFLAGKDPVDPAGVRRWSDLPASARRPGAARARE